MCWRGASYHVFFLARLLDRRRKIATTHAEHVVQLVKNMDSGSCSGCYLVRLERLFWQLPRPSARLYPHVAVSHPLPPSSTLAETTKLKQQNTQESGAEPDTEGS